jgi:hypothetical protein
MVRVNRSPWSNEFTPPLVEATYPSLKLRKLELAANEAFDTYRELYFEGGVSSVYLWDLDPGFAGVVLIKKGIGLGTIAHFFSNQITKCWKYTSCLLFSLPILDTLLL